MRRLVLFSTILAAVLGAPLLGGALPDAPEVQFVFFSDVHFGLERTSFRGAEHVDASVVNAAMAARINALPAATFPKDGGLRSGQPVGPVDFVAVGGDIANRAESTDEGDIQSGAISWAQFESVYVRGLTLLDRHGAVAPLFVVPGNHDASNAVGHYKMAPGSDPVPMLELFNRAMDPAIARTPATYRYATDKVRTSRNIGGVHLEFVTVWPDTATRVWMERDLAEVRPSTPVFIFAHDPPDSDPKHFINPNGAHDVNAVDQFENVLSEPFADGPTPTVPALIEQRAFERFLGRHPNITAYFHGHSNFTQFYDWTGPGHSAALHAFRADSPMKGALSLPDETKLSFLVASVDMSARTMTVRECLWNADPGHPSGPLAWGGSTTVALAPRPPAAGRGVRR